MWFKKPQVLTNQHFELSGGDPRRPLRELPLSASGQGRSRCQFFGGPAPSYSSPSSGRQGQAAAGEGDRASQDAGDGGSHAGADQAAVSLKSSVARF